MSTARADIIPEIELLLLCARVQLDSWQTERIRSLLQGDLDWDTVLRIASRHRIRPLVYWHLRAVCAEAVPAAALDALHQHFYDNAGHNLLLTGELLQLLKLFDGHGIAAIPYKGPALAAGLYGNLSLREISDLDIVVRRQDVLKIKDLMLSQGYGLEYPQCRFNARQEAAFLQSQIAHHYVFRGDDSAVVEIHWQVGAPSFDYFLDLESLWPRLKLIPLAGTMVPGFAPEDLLVLLCLHGAKHSWSNLEWICGVAELVRVHGDMDWKRVMQQAAAVDAKRVVRLGLILATDLLDAPLPLQVLEEACSDEIAGILATRLGQELLEETEAPSMIGQLFEQLRLFLFYIRLKESWRGRVGSVRQYVRLITNPNPLDWAFLPLPPSLYFLYHFIRPWRLLSKYVGGSLQHIFSDRG
jgi:hypothetical protein